MWTNWGGKGGGELAGQTGRGGNWAAGNTGQRAGYRQAGGKSGEIGDRIDQAGGIGVTGREMSTRRSSRCQLPEYAEAMLLPQSPGFQSSHVNCHQGPANVGLHGQLWLGDALRSEASSHQQHSFDWVIGSLGRWVI